MEHGTLPSARRAELERLLREQFGLPGAGDPPPELRALPGERDDNFCVTAGGRRLLLKVMHEGCPEGLVDLQARALEHVAARRPGLPLQRVVRTVSGQRWATLPGSGTGGARLAWLATWLPGRSLSAVRPPSAELHRAAGALLGRLATALADFDHPQLDREISWDLRRAGWIRAHVGALADAGDRARVQELCDRFASEWSAALERLPRAPVHGDANDHNLLVDDGPGLDGPRLCGLIDLGDLCRTARVAEVAVAGAYALLRADDPVAALAAVTAGYHAEVPLGDEELALVFPLALVRLCVSVVRSALSRREGTGGPYASVHEADALRALAALHDRDERVAAARVRAACGLDPWPRGSRLVRWLQERRGSFAAVLGPDLQAAPRTVLDLSFGSLLGGDDPERFEPDVCAARIDAALAAAGARIGIGRYGEPRPLYPGPAFGDTAPNARRRTRHLGIDLFAPAGTPVAAAWPGEVARAIVCPGRLDYGGLVVLRHEATELAAAGPFATLYGHLAPESIAALRAGRQVAKGEVFARLGAPPGNGDWPPHLHLQIIADAPGRGPEVPPGVALPEEFEALAALHPDPSPLLDLPPAARWEPVDSADLLARRRARFPANLRLGHGAPVHPVRGRRHFLYDQFGRRFVDAYNNVPHVGHAHPRVVEAVRAQSALLAANTRYLDEGLAAYADRLVQRLPPSLRERLTVCLLVASGSEANELALRLCRAHTGARELLVMEHGYHGHTTGAMDVSPYKHGGAGGPGRAPDWVHVVPQPDLYRGPFRGADAGARHAALVQERLDRLAAEGRAVAGFLSELLPSVGGQIVPPPGYFAAVYAAVRAAGGVCIGDDVQTALGRTGACEFGCELVGAEPDVLVLGKPLGNGYPIGAVLTTEAIAASFAKGPEFFSTFGGNTVACAAGRAVLDVLDAEDLRSRALATGTRLLAGLRALQREFALVGDVRGSGLFVGVDLVRDRDRRTPAAAAARHVRDRLREHRILVGTDGPHDNVLKIRPPMTFDGECADTLLAVLAEVLREDRAQPDARGS